MNTSKFELGNCFVLKTKMFFVDYTFQYEAIGRPADFQFHSCEEERNPINNFSAQSQQNPPNNLAPPPPRGEIVRDPRKVTIMAF
jgi:hypothetical protein